MCRCGMSWSRKLEITATILGDRARDVKRAEDSEQEASLA